MSDILFRLAARAQGNPVCLTRPVRYRFAPVTDVTETGSFPQGTHAPDARETIPASESSVVPRATDSPETTDQAPPDSAPPAAVQAGSPAPPMSPASSDVTGFTAETDSATGSSAPTKTSEERSAILAASPADYEVSGKTSERVGKSAATRAMPRAASDEPPQSVRSIGAAGPDASPAAAPAAEKSSQTAPDLAPPEPVQTGTAERPTSPVPSDVTRFSAEADHAKTADDDVTESGTPTKTSKSRPAMPAASSADYDVSGKTGERVEKSAATRAMLRTASDEPPQSVRSIGAAGPDASPTAAPAAEKSSQTAPDLAPPEPVQTGTAERPTSPVPSDVTGFTAEADYAKKADDDVTESGAPTKTSKSRPAMPAASSAGYDVSGKTGERAEKSAATRAMPRTALDEPPQPGTSLGTHVLERHADPARARQTAAASSTVQKRPAGETKSAQSGTGIPALNARPGPTDAGVPTPKQAADQESALDRSHPASAARSGGPHAERELSRASGTNTRHGRTTETTETVTNEIHIDVGRIQIELPRARHQRAPRQRPNPPPLQGKPRGGPDG